MPKCAGTSVRHAIGRALDEDCPAKGRVVRVETRPSVKTAKLLNMEVQQFREQMLLYFMADPICRFISGHFSFSEAAWRHYSDDWSFVTLLRHPVNRWFSHYFFNRFKKSSHTAISMELEEFTHTERARELGCEYVRRLAPGVGISNAGSSKAIDKALENLERVSLVGLVEKTDEFCVEFERQFKLKPDLSVMNRNPAPEQQQQALENAGFLQIVEELCQPDIQVYEHALRRHNLLHCTSTSTA